MYFVIFEKYPWYFFVTKKKEGVPQAIFEKYHGTFLVIIMLKFASNIRYTLKKSMKLFCYFICGGGGWVVKS